MMNRCLQPFVHQNRRNLARLAGALAVWAVVAGSGGCATGRPSPLVVENQITTMPANRSGSPLRLKLVTYNIWGLPSWMTGAPSGRYPRIARELERLDPDIILLQEAWTAKARKSAPANGRWAVARAAGQRTFFQQSGLVTLSKFPIIGGEFYPFSRAAFPDRFVQKGVLKVTVQLPGGPVLNVWNVHLQDGGSPEIRLSQVRELVSRIQQSKDDQVADLVGGDFNCTPESSLYRVLESALGPSVQQARGMVPFATWDGLSEKPGAGQVLDYVFVRGLEPFLEPQSVSRAAFAADSIKQRLSDHLGIEAVVDLSPINILAGESDPLLINPRLPVAARQTVYAGGKQE